MKKRRRSRSIMATPIIKTATASDEAYLIDVVVQAFEADPAGNTDITLWEFETGIPYVKNWMELLMPGRE
jgi:hypothetical protein